MKLKKEIAVFGCGYWGTIVINSILKLKLFKKIYIYDPDYKKVSILKKRFKNVLIYRNFNEIYKDKNIKNIYLATHPDINYSVLKQCIKNKKNILIEKPGLTNLNQFKKIKQLIKKNKIRIFFGYVYLFNQYIKYIKKIIAKKTLGNIKYINFQRQNFGPIRDGVSSIFDLATHDLSILHFIFNKTSKLKKIVKHDLLNKKNFDISYLNLELGKIKVDINVSWLNPEKIRKIIFIGSKKMLVFDEMNKKKPIQIFNNYVYFPKIDKFSKQYFGKTHYIFKGKSISLKLNTKLPLDEEIRAFVNEKKIIPDIDFSENIIKTLSKKL
tara:strand:- start:971 stop:1945 length:975 start_codon:yes stop_codon:yes gene_type:complete